MLKGPRSFSITGTAVGVERCAPEPLIGAGAAKVSDQEVPFHT